LINNNKKRQPSSFQTVTGRRREAAKAEYAKDEASESTASSTYFIPSHLITV
jgi:hypothetical protein